MNHPNTDLLDGKWLKVHVKPGQFSRKISCWSFVERPELLLVPKDMEWMPSVGESIEVLDAVFKIVEIDENCQDSTQKSFLHYDCVIERVDNRGI